MLTTTQTLRDIARSLTLACLLVSATALFSTNVFAQAECKLADNKKVTGWSGKSGGTLVRLGTPSSNMHAVKSISNYQQGKKPCRTAITLMRMPNAVGERLFLHHESDTCGGPSINELTVGNVSNRRDDAGFVLRDNLYVSGIQVCNSAPADPADAVMTGLRVNLREVDDYSCSTRMYQPPPVPMCVTIIKDGGFTTRVCDEVGVLAKDRPDCSDVQDFRRCPEGMVATEVHLNLGPEGPNGARLACRSVISK